MTGRRSGSNPYRQWFCALVWLGVAVNFVLAGPVVILPGVVLPWLGLESVPDFWAALSAFLVILISLFYVPAALDPDRYRACAWLAVFARTGSALFLMMAVAVLSKPLVLLVPALLDLFFAFLQGVLLVFSVRADRLLQS